MAFCEGWRALWEVGGGGIGGLGRILGFKRVFGKGEWEGFWEEGGFVGKGRFFFGIVWGEMGGEAEL